MPEMDSFELACDVIYELKEEGEPNTPERVAERCKQRKTFTKGWLYHLKHKDNKKYFIIAHGLIEPTNRLEEKYQTFKNKIKVQNDAYENCAQGQDEETACKNKFGFSRISVRKWIFEKYKREEEDDPKNSFRYVQRVLMRKRSEGEDSETNVTKDKRSLDEREVIQVIGGRTSGKQNEDDPEVIPIEIKISRKPKDERLRIVNETTSKLSPWRPYPLWLMNLMFWELPGKLQQLYLWVRDAKRDIFDGKIIEIKNVVRFHLLERCEFKLMPEEIQKMLNSLGNIGISLGNNNEEWERMRNEGEQDIRTEQCIKGRIDYANNTIHASIILLILYSQYVLNKTKLDIPKFLLEKYSFIVDSLKQKLNKKKMPQRVSSPEQKVPEN